MKTMTNEPRAGKGPARARKLAGAITIEGIDVSHYQGAIDWQKAKAASVGFAYAKASEGSSWRDSRFSPNRSGASAAGIPFGAYHFFRPRADVTLQVKNFVATVGSIQPGELPPVLDAENPLPWRRFSVAKRVALIAAWMKGVEDALGVSPLLYLSPSFATDVLGSSSQLADWRLWLADYTTSGSPVVPAPWSASSPTGNNQHSGWTFWQYTDRGSVEGVAGPVDMDRFFGSSSQLLELLAK